MTVRIDSDADLQTGLAALARAVPRFREIWAEAGTPPLRRRPGGFTGLASIVVSQQVSTASAAAIWGRLSQRLDPLDHTAMLRARRDKLVRIGLSGAKIVTLRAVAKAIDTGTLDLERLIELPADEAHAVLTALHGIGPWTADIYLLVCLGHADAWPAGDLALQEAARAAFGLRERPATKQMGPLAESWRPWRAVAARLLWSYYRVIKGRDVTPVPTPILSGSP
jgi:DNA-3-methyladenine glycosylase II